MDVNLHIERLVLDGMNVEHRHRIDVINSVVVELRGALLSMPDNTHLKTMSVHSHVFSSQFMIEKKLEPTNIGKKIGSAIHGSLTK